jgi:hypothetical protein
VVAPWQFDPARIAPDTWLLLGEALSKSNHIARIPLGAVLGDRADRAGVLRGAFATLRLDGVRSVPKEGPLAEGARWSSPAPDPIPARARPVVDAIDALADNSLKLLPEMTPSAIGAIQSSVDPDSDVVLEGALPSLCTWLNGPCFQASDPSMAFALAVIKACCAHVALLDPPYSRAGGSTARLLEIGLLLQSAALPLRSASAGTEHYRDTPQQYRRQIETAVSTRRPEAFIDYAVCGMVYRLRRQLDVELQPLWMRRQWDATWESFARARLTGSGVSEVDRARCLDLLLSLGEKAMSVSSLSSVGDDLVTLVDLGLVRSDGQTCMANLDAIRVWPGPR